MRDAQGDYDDFTSKWYTNVGSQIATTMLLNAIVPNFWLVWHVVVKAWWRRRRGWNTKVRASRAPACLRARPITRRCRCWSRQVTQRELDLLFAGDDFDLSTRYPDTMNTLFTCVAFSGGQPVLLFIASGTFVVQYWIDKWLLLRHFRIPPAYDHQLSAWAINILPFCIFIHICMSMWAYGSDDIFVSVRARLRREGARCSVTTRASPH